MVLVKKHNKSIQIAKIWILFLFIATLPNSVSGQNYFFDNYGVSEGLAQSTIFDILQDQNHNIWLGTRAGVSKFDGKNFTNYSIEHNLAPNGVKVIYKDKLNRIWLGHAEGGITLYENNRFTVFSKTGEFFKSDITAIEADSVGNIWISSELSGAIKITQPKETLKESVYEHYFGNQLSDRIFGVYTLKSGKTIFITDAFLKQYNRLLNKFENFEIAGMPRFFQITTLFEDSSGHLWFGTHHGGLYEYNPQTNKFSFYDYLRDGIGSNWITTITEDSNHTIYVGTWEGGVAKISPQREIINFNTKNGLPDPKIRKIYIDAEGNALIGTNEHGLAIFKGELFVNFFHNDNQFNAQIVAIEIDSDNTYWFGTYDGITLLKKETKGTFTSSKLDKLKGNKIRFIKEDNQKRVWIATDNEGIFTYNLKNKTLDYKQILNTYIPNLTVNAMATDKKGNLWVGTLDGLIKYNCDKNSIDYYSQTSGLATNDISSLFIDSKGTVWIGGSKGKGVTVYENEQFSIIPLPAGYTPKSFSESPTHEIWMGTEAHGVIVLSQKEKTIKTIINEENGIYANLINLIHCDKNDRVYIGTNRGLNILDSKTEKIYSFSKRNGLSGIETKPNSVAEDAMGNIWIGTIDGAFALNPNHITKKTIEPQTHITKLRVNLTEKEMSNNLSLKYNQNNIIFDYISICLSNPDAVKYKILLEGADKEWRTVTETSVTYPALVPNSYTFNVLAQNGDGYWNQHPIQFHFEIRPPFWRTWWFILLCITLGTILLLLYIKIRVKNLKEQKEMLEVIVKERTAEVVAQKEELSSKNKDITDSIRYAKRIQFAVIPEEIPFKETFVLLKPKDIVSGDFYWIYKKDNLEFLAAVDCTGHGVPGAFMSIIGCNLLNKIIRENNIYQPSKILDALNKELLLSLPSQEGEVIQDGMDLSLVCYNTQTGQLAYAGAFNPLYIVQKGVISEIKADRFSIGRSSLEMHNQFTNYEVQIEQGDCIYLFSDGYADQFGGPEGKKFKYKTLKDLLLEIHTYPIEDQKEILNITIETWRGDLEQVDDILILGRRF